MTHGKSYGFGKITHKNMINAKCSGWLDTTMALSARAAEYTDYVSAER